MEISRICSSISETKEKTLSRVLFSDVIVLLPCFLDIQWCFLRFDAYSIQFLWMICNILHMLFILYYSYYKFLSLWSTLSISVYVINSFIHSLVVDRSLCKWHAVAITVEIRNRDLLNITCLNSPWDLAKTVLQNEENQCDFFSFQTTQSVSLTYFLSD